MIEPRPREIESKIRAMLFVARSHGTRIDAEAIVSRFKGDYGFSAVVNAIDALTKEGVIESYDGLCYRLTDK